jgi:peptidoglycan/xylan/chitin deacetylase (PgdA/CDA1 family)
MFFIVKIKHELQNTVRACHRVFLTRPLPEILGLYFHSLEEPLWEAFAEMAVYFREQGYKTAGPDTIHQARTTSAVFYSFDDNYQSWHRALDLLDTLAIRATFYINTLPIRDRSTPEIISEYYDRIAHGGDRTPLSSREIVDLADRGHTVGCHTRSHFNLKSLPEKDARAEIQIGKEDLEEILGRRVVHFSYPFGFRRHFRPALKSYCRTIGLQTIANATPALQFRPPNPYSLNRSVWHLNRPLEYNLENLRMDGRFFTFLTGRSAVG